MDTTSLVGLIFFLVFMGMILIHEAGHYFASLLVGVEVEEFGFGIPPRAWTFARLKGYFLTKNGKRIEIPRDFGLPFPWSELSNHEVKFTVDRDGDKFILRSMDVVEEVPEKRQPDLRERDELLVGQNGEAAQNVAPAAPKTRTVHFGKTRGSLELTEVISESHPGTEFTLNWLPLGGFVRPKGENDPSIPGGLAAAAPWKRLVVLFAGPIMNLIAGVIVYSLIFAQAGVPVQVKLAEVFPNTPAASAGLQAGDVLLSVNGQTISTAEGMRIIIRRNLDKPLTIVVDRDGQPVTVIATPLSSRYKDGALGIGMESVTTPATSWFATLPASFNATYEQGYEILSMPAQMARGLISPEDGRFIGLKGILDLFKVVFGLDVESRTQPAATGQGQPAPTYGTLSLIAVLTISIGLFNLLPFPALDGGRIAFVLPELVLRRRVPPQFENAVHAAGMLFLILLMIYVNVMDFVNPINLNP